MKKIKKSIEEKYAEEFFVVDKNDLKYATEKSFRDKINGKDFLKNVTTKSVKDAVNFDNKASIGKIYNKPTKIELEKTEIILNNDKKSKSKKKLKKDKSNKLNVKYSVSNVQLKQKGYELIITEKPQAALKIANSLGDSVQKSINNVPYHEVDRNGIKILVACAVGHLFTLKQKSSISENVPIFDLVWTPNYMSKKGDFTKKYYDTILKLVKNAKSLTIATDYDIEGEVIGMNVMRYICNQPDASRMKFSTLTKDELNKSYENKTPHIDWGQAIAGETRHYLDWFYGINLSRCLMNAIKKTGKFKIMSIGRVQGPTLNIIVKREKEIINFKPVPYWNVSIFIEHKNKRLELNYTKDIFDKSELSKFENLIGKKVLIKTNKEERKLSPLPPFNLTSLQTEAYRIYGISPKNTLQIAQSLYLAGLISYPRTSSEKLPVSVGYEKILRDLTKDFKFKNLIIRNKPVEGKKIDPAHPSIYPTGNKQILKGDELKIYNLIVNRFICLFCDDAVIENKSLMAESDGLKFSLNGQMIKNKSWLEIYPYKIKEEKIPDINEEKEILDLKINEKETQPPKRYSPASIISTLEKKNLGTKATRSSILETLYDRAYIEWQNIKATPLGISLIESLEKYSPIIIDENLTREFEDSMENIQSKKNKDELIKEKEKIIEKAKKIITKIVKDFKKNEVKIGLELINANNKFREQQKLENQIMKCNKCNNGNLGIMYSKKNKRFFIACNAYPNCKNTFSLPPNGVIKRTNKVCSECYYPMLMKISKGKKPWTFCWNPNCKTNANWADKRENNSFENTKV